MPNRVYRQVERAIPPLSGVPVRQLVARIAGFEVWRVDMWAATPGSRVYGLPAEAAAGFVDDHLGSLRAELRRREGIAEVAP